MEGQGGTFTGNEARDCFPADPSPCSEGLRGRVRERRVPLSLAPPGEDDGTYPARTAQSSPLQRPQGPSVPSAFGRPWGRRAFVCRSADGPPCVLQTAQGSSPCRRAPCSRHPHCGFRSLLPRARTPRALRPVVCPVTRPVASGHSPSWDVVSAGISSAMLQGDFGLNCDMYTFSSDDGNTLAPFLPASLIVIANTCEKYQDGPFLLHEKCHQPTCWLVNIYEAGLPKNTP